MKAVIFDMNGVLVNDERFHQQAWREMCKRRGFELSEEEFEKYVFGRTEKETLQYLMKREVSDEEAAEFSEERIEIVISIYKDKISLLAGLDVFLPDLYKSGVVMGMATSSRRPYADFVVDTLKIRRYFKSILSAEDITNGKPDPEIYLKSAERLSVDIGHCVVFEDSFSGIQSGKNAGMKVYGVATTQKREEIAKYADVVINDFTEISVADIV